MNRFAGCESVLVPLIVTEQASNRCGSITITSTRTSTKILTGGQSERVPSIRAASFPDRLLGQSDNPGDAPDRLLAIELPVDHQALVRRDAPEHVEHRRGDDALRLRPLRGAG